MRETPAPPASVCILVDSRCISSGVELLTSLRQRHAATVQVCSLDGGYFIVSNRMAVERHSQSDLASMQSRKRLTERVNSLQGQFERVCMIVEKDRTKTGKQQVVSPSVSTNINCTQKLALNDLTFPLEPVSGCSHGGEVETAPAG